MSQEKKEELQRLIEDGRCRITDDDFARAELSPAEEETLIYRMCERGYTIGRDENGQNEWWPPSFGEADDARDGR